MDNNLQDMIAKAVVDIIKQKEDNKGIKVGVSARHVHLSQEHWKFFSVRDTNLL